MVVTKLQEQVTSGDSANSAVVPGERPIMMSVQHVTKHYKTGTGTVHALEDLSLEIPKGEFLCILGPSGCGKSTLLWGMSGLHDLTGGQITINGTPVTGPRPEIGMIFQDANLLPWRDLWQNIRFPFEIKNIDFKPYEGRVKRLLDDADHNIRLVKLGHGVHNLAYSTALLNAAIEWCNQVKPGPQQAATAGGPG